ncbi:hypothetical protein ACOMHN_004376 [Nucella lapillus]
MDSGHQILSTLAEVFTPCFLVDIDRLKNNTQRMLDTCRRLNVDLRPHMKTHKTVEGAEIMTGGTRRKIVCSTLAECEMYADNGFDDILLAFPITAEKIIRCAALTNRLESFHVFMSGVEGVKCLQEGTSLLTDGRHWSVFLELDCGYKRTGFLWDGPELLDTALLIHQSPRLQLQGLYTHCGMSYTKVTPDQRAADQKTLVDRLTKAADRLRSAGIKVPVVGTGSTPTCSLPESVLSTLDEFHPGNYVFYDLEHVLLGACRQEDIAGCVATRVVCRRPETNTLIVDCGFTGLSHDGREQVGDDFCTIRGHPHLRLFNMSQELGKIRAKEGENINWNDYPVGTMLFIDPFHSCATANSFGQYIVHSGQKVVDFWKPVKGW